MSEEGSRGLEGDQAKVEMLARLITKANLQEREGRGNQKLYYVDKDYVSDVFDAVVGPMAWSRRTTKQVVVSELEQPGEVTRRVNGKENRIPCVHYAITAMATVSIEVDFGGGRKVVREGTGVDTNNGPTGEGWPVTAKGDIISTAIKSAESDAFKRAAQSFGYATGRNVDSKGQKRLVLFDEPARVAAGQGSGTQATNGAAPRQVASSVEQGRPSVGGPGDRAQGAAVVQPGAAKEADEPADKPAVQQGERPTAATVRPNEAKPAGAPVEAKAAVSKPTESKPTESKPSTGANGLVGTDKPAAEATPTAPANNGVAKPATTIQPAPGPNDPATVMQRHMQSLYNHARHATTSAELETVIDLLGNQRDVCMRVSAFYTFYDYSFRKLTERANDIAPALVGRVKALAIPDDQIPEPPKA